MNGFGENSSHKLFPNVLQLHVCCVKAQNKMVEKTEIPIFPSKTVNDLARQIGFIIRLNFHTDFK